MSKATTIRIEILDEDGEVVVVREALSMESAEEALGKLERFIERQQIPNTLL